MRTVLKILIGILVGFVLAGVLLLLSRRPTGTVIPLVPPPTASPIVVHVVGAVPRPGVYEFPKGARIRDAIDAAGGLLTDANITAINMAALLKDGQRLEIPSLSGTPGTPDALSPGVEATFVAACAGDKININTASVEQLRELGLSQTTADELRAYIEENGYFVDYNAFSTASISGLTDIQKVRLKNIITFCAP
ncbi:MAG: SLBB domain-containing protein [Chloroflexi bacterium]|nr:SLBB domain-containing protein [Chloroflexota bacterium]